MTSVSTPDIRFGCAVARIGALLLALAATTASAQTGKTGYLTLKTPNAEVMPYGSPATLQAEVSGTQLISGTMDFVLDNGDGTKVGICEKIQMVFNRASCVVPGYLNKAGGLYAATYSGDSVRIKETVGIRIFADLANATLTLAANPARPASFQPLKLVSIVNSRSPAGRVTFRENGVALPGCDAVPTVAMPNATDAAAAACTVAGAAVVNGVHTYTAIFDRGDGSATRETTLQVLTDNSGRPDYTGMYWAGAAENGWGLSVTQHGENQFIAFYVYDSAGRPVWYVLPAGTWNAAHTAFSGALYMPNSVYFQNYDAGQFRPGAPVGNATITYNGLNAATLNYTINGVTDSKNLQRQLFGVDDGKPVLPVGDLWWGGDGQRPYEHPVNNDASQVGWGVNIAQDGNMLFPVWYTYDGDNRGGWYSVPGGTWSGMTFTGDVYRTASSPWLGTAYNVNLLKVNKVGTMSLSFIDQNHAVMRYVINGVAQTKAITRQPF